MFESDTRQVSRMQEAGVRYLHTARRKASLPCLCERRCCMSIRMLQGDCRETLPTLEANSVQAVITSPPY